MKRKHRHQSRPAFVTLLAIVMLGLVATALTSAALLIREDVRRTQSAQIDAQLRQLLLAGISDAVARSTNWSDTIQPQTWSIALPNDPLLQEATLSADLQSISPASAQVRISATLAAQPAEEELLFQRVGNEWKLTETRLGPPG
jgi:Na+-transporting NADH:ubiquinone oxidoreductase subunit NqrC